MSIKFAMRFTFFASVLISQVSFSDTVTIDAIGTKKVEMRCLVRSNGNNAGKSKVNTFLVDNPTDEPGKYLCTGASVVSRNYEGRYQDPITAEYSSTADLEFETFDPNIGKVNKILLMVDQLPDTHRLFAQISHPDTKDNPSNPYVYMRSNLTTDVSIGTAYLDLEDPRITFTDSSIDDTTWIMPDGSKAFDFPNTKQFMNRRDLRMRMVYPDPYYLLHDPIYTGNPPAPNYNPSRYPASDPRRNASCNLIKTGNKLGTKSCAGTKHVTFSERAVRWDLTDWNSNGKVNSEDTPIGNFSDEQRSLHDQLSVSQILDRSPIPVTLKTNYDLEVWGYDFEGTTFDGPGCGKNDGGDFRECNWQLTFDFQNVPFRVRLKYEYTRDDTKDGAGSANPCGLFTGSTGCEYKLDSIGGKSLVSSEFSPSFIDNAKPNIVDLSSETFEIALLSYGRFDATLTDVDSIDFGILGIDPKSFEFADVDGNERDDLVLTFETDSLGATCGEYSETIAGGTLDGNFIESIATYKVEYLNYTGQDLCPLKELFGQPPTTFEPAPIGLPGSGSVSSRDVLFLGLLLGFFAGRRRLKQS
jgi:hypothetical protein